MNSLVARLALVPGMLLSPVLAEAEVNIAIGRHDGDAAAAGFVFTNVPSPSRNDAATQATFKLVDGRRDANGGELEALHDGRGPVEGDEPAANFFFAPRTDGGRILVDLGSAREVKQVNTYSWHTAERGPQVYVLYGSDGQQPSFNPEPKKGTDPAGCGWKKLASVDTRPQGDDFGGQYGVSVSDSSGTLGKLRYLLFDIARTEQRDAFGNTFWSEIDVVDANGPAPEPIDRPSAGTGRRVVQAEDGKYQIVIDTSETPDLEEFVEKRLTPAVQEWYPKLVRMLPSEGFTAPTKFSIVFKKDMRGVADTSGTRIRVAAKWFRQNLKGESIGAVVHEVVHVVQQYGRQRGPSARQAPGWLTEGLTDYIRFYCYEPQTRGAEISQRGLANAKYNNSYRVTANFIHYMSEKYDKEFVTKLNGIIRQGRYREETWKELTGRTVQELGEEWKKSLEEKLGAKQETK